MSLEPALTPRIAQLPSGRSSCQILLRESFPFLRTRNKDDSLITWNELVHPFIHSFILSLFFFLFSNVTMRTVAHFIMNNAFTVDAKAQDEKLRTTEPLLLHPNESIQLALKEGRDHRDKSYFTTHRLLVKDGKGMTLSKKRKNFKSIPYSTIQGFAIRRRAPLTMIRNWKYGDRRVVSCCISLEDKSTCLRFNNSLVWRY